MTRLFTICFAAFFTPLFLQAQHNHDHLHPCATDMPGMEMDHRWLKEYRLNPQNFPTPEDDLIIAELQVHNVGQDNGTGFFAWRQMLDALCQLQEAFEPTDIQFWMTNDVNFIANTEWNNHDNFGTGAQLMWQNKVNGMLNTFISTEAAGACGYYSPGPDATVVAKSCNGASDDTWAHEMGHYLSLPHTFLGWEGVDYDPSIPINEYLDDVFAIENLDGSNCNASGDFFCDTAPDYLSNRWNCNNNDETSATFTDLNGDEFNIDGTPYMSYSNDLCMNKFSPEQIDAMRANLVDQRSNVILDDVVIEEIDVNDFEPVFPQPNDEVSYNYLKIEWEQIPGASHYYVEVTRYPFGVIQYKGVTAETEFIVTDMAIEKDYAYTVRPFNRGNFCQPNSEQIIFTTNATTSTNEIVGVEEISFFPTTLRSGQQLNIAFTSTQNLPNSTLSITDLTGRIVESLEIDIISGQNQFTLNTTDLAAGIYVAAVVTERGSRYQKIVIQ